MAESTYCPCIKNLLCLVYTLHHKKLVFYVLLLMNYCLFLLFLKGFVPEEAQHFKISQVARERPLKNCLDCYGVSLLPMYSNVDTFIRKCS
jgi:hypothetical protein